MPHTRSAAVQFYVSVGARHEEPGIAGISHFLEHMVFKGTEKRPNPVQISEAIEGVGGSLDAATDHEQTNYRALVPSNYLATGLEVITDMLRNPRLLASDVEKERAVIIEEISSTQDSPGEMVDLLFDETLWPEHALGRDVAGTKKSVRHSKERHLRAHLETNYRPDRIVISVAGNIRHGDVVQEVERLWGDAEPADADENRERTLVPPVVEARGPEVKVQKKRTEQVNLIVGVPALSYTHPERYTQDVLDALLGGGMSSRLFVEVRENRGLAYAVSSFVRSYSDAGAFGVHAAVDNTQIEQALQAIMGEMGRIRGESVPEVELRKVKEYIKGHTLLSLERSGYVAHWNGWQELTLGRVQEVDEVLDCIEAVEAHHVGELAARLFREEHLRLAVVGSRKSEDDLRSRLVLS